MLDDVEHHGCGAILLDGTADGDSKVLVQLAQRGVMCVVAADRLDPEMLALVAACDACGLRVVAWDLRRRQEGVREPQRVFTSTLDAPQ